MGVFGRLAAFVVLVATVCHRGKTFWAKYRSSIRGTRASKKYKYGTRCAIKWLMPLSMYRSVRIDTCAECSNTAQLRESRVRLVRLAGPGGLPFKKHSLNLSNPLSSTRPPTTPPQDCPGALLLNFIFDVGMCDVRKPLEFRMHVLR